MRVWGRGKITSEALAERPSVSIISGLSLSTPSGNDDLNTFFSSFRPFAVTISLESMNIPEESAGEGCIEVHILDW